MEQDGWVLDSPSTFSGFKRCNFNNDEDSNLSRKRIRATFLTQPSAHQTITASTQSLPLGGTQDDDLRYRSMDTIQQYNQIISFSQWSSKDDCTSTNSHSIALSENGGREAETRSLEPRCQMSKEEETNGKRATPVEVNLFLTVH
jgi:hypothetical protein